ncbi:hypothetical protein J3U31_02710 [Gilliamella sp. B3486]|uniref:hypothetical protein n=1 Tax=unclassified Gilliamella TaxID=2685620 RepID=UPI00226A0165|nr:MULTISPECIES: hypothetical protein [unclassified Gilliamella]MCX8596782.1 hypothetical protein [Gilliamella sp. B3493]MCX8598511.1 hypothetical protein [Gilliamella sp. B3486]MCX8704498.1 hypothetical protein [Gilliamella sp. B3127]
MSELNHNELCLIADKFLKRNGFGVVFHDRYQACIGTGEKPDAIGFRNNVSLLIECKTSRSDFLADKKKTFRINPNLGMGDWRFYLCPPDLIKIDDLPIGWGLLYACGNRVRKIHGFPTNVTLITDKPFNSNKQAECDFLYGALRRMVIRGHFDDIYTKYNANE